MPTVGALNHRVGDNKIAIDNEAYKQIMRRFPSGVTVITATDRHGRDFGLTVSAFAAVSLDPPLVLVCVATNSNTLPAIQESRAFTVNILATGQGEVALRFASKDTNKFAGDQQALRLAPTGPILAPGVVVAHMQCQVIDEVMAGDHWVFIGRVDGGEEAEGLTPLVYYDGSFGTVGPPSD